MNDTDLSKLSYTLIVFMFGFSSACAAFTGAKIIQQTYRTWRRSKNIHKHPFIIMIIAEWVSSVLISIISFLFIDGVIQPGFALFFIILCLWVIQIQCIMQIIINRVALIIYDQNRVRRLKWATAVLAGAINISVFIIWMPARLQVSPHWVQLNDVWDRVEKGIFALGDLGLNVYFIYLVRKELIRYGLTKYILLYRYNIGMILISMSLDVVLIGVMSLPGQSSFIYVQFHPLMYLIKLNIEMNMAELIRKIVRAGSQASTQELYGSSEFNSVQSDRRATISRPNAAARKRSETTSSVAYLSQTGEPAAGVGLGWAVVGGDIDAAGCSCD
ncbi:hypothetical protein BD289DRAFT_50021 [Coniella lustricola]|uniref:Integral membrane protein n=1 Tax=Coniella lustricola TaxID=2025994 RepID=A0A2T3A1G6_9PEZI|nr:hypothetical protein BD289DRAFT_50021 [Coniella lustricola]